MSRRIVLLLVCLLACLSASTVVAASDAPVIDPGANNPPPAMPLGAFQRFEVAPVAMGAPFTEYKTNLVAQERLQANLDERVAPLVAEWNARPADEAPRTLRIEPQIRYVRFITGGKRFWGGAMAGDSSMLVQLRLTDAQSGELVAAPDFYQRANAFGAAWSFGGTDKHMVIRLSAMVADYLRNNYDTAVGGPVAVAPGHEE